MDVSQFLTGDLILLGVALGGVGVMIKNTNRLDSALIPFILLPIGVIFAVMINGFGAISILQGVVATMGAVYGNNAIKQGQELIDKVENNEKIFNLEIKVKE